MMKIQAEAAASHNRVVLDRDAHRPAARNREAGRQGIAGANLTVLDGSDGLGRLATGLVSHGLAIFDALRGELGRDQPNGEPDSIAMHGTNLDRQG